MPIIYESHKLLLNFYINCSTGDETHYPSIPLPEVDSDRILSA